MNGTCSDFEKVVNTLGLHALSHQLASDWSESEIFMPQLECLRSEELSANAEFAGLQAEVVALVVTVAEEILAHPELARLFRHGLWQLSKKTTGSKFDQWPENFPQLGDRSGLFYVILGVSLIPSVQAWHRSLGLPENVTRDTCRQVSDFVENYRRGTGGLLGLYSRQLSWLWNYPRQRYFRLGRLEYRLWTFYGDVQVYRHQHTNRVVALAAKSDVSFGADGYRAHEATPEAAKWTPSLRETAESVTGFPVTPHGYAITKEVTLSLSEWKLVLKGKDAVLDVHIPQGGGLTPEACLESHRLALEFFARYFPEDKFVALCCKSWMFNTQLEEILAPESNLLRYMRDLYLFPIPSEKNDGLWFLFLQDNVDFETAPQETSLQRSVLQFLKKGHRWRSGGMFMLREDALRIGEQYYRTQWQMPE